MLSVGIVVLAALLWLGLLFGSALYAERHPRVLAVQWPYIYALSLAVYCTSWTFFGTVTQAARYGWPLRWTSVWQGKCHPPRACSDADSGGHRLRHG